MPGTTSAALSLYADGEPAYEKKVIAIWDPLPILGVHSDSTGPWHAYVVSSRHHDKELTDGQIDYSKHPIGHAAIIPYQAPYGYEMITDGFEETGVQFTMRLWPDFFDASGTRILLWDTASVFDVPVDTLHILRGGSFPSGYIEADAGGPYVLAPGGSVTFNAGGSTQTLYDPYGNPETFGVGDGWGSPWWRINNVDIAFGITPTISYDTLIGGLGLTPGVYELTFNLRMPIGGEDTAVTTIEILPEPASILLLILGGLWIIRRR